MPVISRWPAPKLAPPCHSAGETSKALELLEFAVDHGMYPYLFYRDFCPFMQPLRGLPEFDRIVAKAQKRVSEFDA